MERSGSPCPRWAQCWSGRGGLVSREDGVVGFLVPALLGSTGTRSRYGAGALLSRAFCSLSLTHGNAGNSLAARGWPCLWVRILPAPPQPPNVQRSHTGAPSATSRAARHARSGPAVLPTSLLETGCRMCPLGRVIVCVAAADPSLPGPGPKQRRGAEVVPAPRLSSYPTSPRLSLWPPWCRWADRHPLRLPHMAPVRPGHTVDNFSSFPFRDQDSSPPRWGAGKVSQIPSKNLGACLSGGDRWGSL